MQMQENSMKRHCPSCFSTQSLIVSRKSTYKPSNNFSLKIIEFEINEETKEYLKTLQGPLGVLSVAGMYRSGKSYLLNRVLLQRSRGFDVGHTINACTKVSQLDTRLLLDQLMNSSDHKWHKHIKSSKSVKWRHHLYQMNLDWSYTNSSNEENQS